MIHEVTVRTPSQAYDLWIEALENRKYRQVQGSLKKRRNQDGRQGFCCLGVLCDLAAKDGGAQWMQSSKEDAADFLGLSGELAPVIRKFMGMTDDDESHLIEMNDSNGAGFKKIATYIRKELKPAALARLAKKQVGKKRV
jgi:hypothetical protein